MALENNTQLNYTDKTAIKNWFKTGLKPTQAQFWATWDSFWHKDEKLPISSIENLGNLIDGKAEANHSHAEYATNSATSLTPENVTQWQNKLGVADLKFDDQAITTTQDYAEFGLDSGATINAFNNAIYSEVLKKLNAPIENNTSDYVLLADGSTAPQTDFGKVDKVMGIAPDVDKNVDISGVAMNWTNSSQRFSGLVDKSADATFNQFAIFDNNGNLAKANIISDELIKNGEGWSLKYRKDNPSFYGTLGKEALDLSIATKASTDVNFPYGANGVNSQVFGFGNSAMGAGTLIGGGSNKSQGQTNHIVSYRSNILEERGSANKGKYANGIFGGEANVITNSISSVILGGAWHEITGEANPRANTFYNQYNAILGGYRNKIISAAGTNKPAYSSVIFGGEDNIAQGHYNMIAGYKNHAVTIGETLVGLYGTIQNTSLSGYDFISNSRMFNVGIGESTTQGVVTRKDGLSVFRNGLVTAPQLTTSLIGSAPKAIVTKEYLDIRIPKPPTIGNHVLKSVDGVVSWVPE